MEATSYSYLSVTDKELEMFQGAGTVLTAASPAPPRLLRLQHQKGLGLRVQGVGFAENQLSRFLLQSGMEAGLLFLLEHYR